MANDLHARLLAEIERREDNWRQPEPTNGDELGYTAREVLAYLGALRGVVELHTDNGIGCCRTCGDEAWGDDYPCASLRCVAEGLGVGV